MPTANEELRDRLLGRQALLGRYEARLRRKIDAVLVELTRVLTADLGRLDVASRWQPGRLKKLLASARRRITASYAEAEALLRAGLAELAGDEAETILRQIRASAPLVSPLLVALNGRRIGSLVTQRALIEGQTIGAWWKRQEARTLQRFSDELRSGLAAGESHGQLVQRIRGRSTGQRITRTLANGRRRYYHVFRGGAMQATTADAHALVKTATSAVMNRARQELFEANADVIKGTQEVATLDNRTLPISILYDGEWWELPSYTPRGPKGLPWAGGLPRHWNERDSLIPVLKSWQELGIDAREIEPGERASMDGSVPSTLTATEWVARQPRSRLNQLFGPGRAALYDAGRITVRDMLDKDLRPLTLAQINDRLG